MAPRKTTKPKPTPRRKLTEEQKAARQAQRARAAARRQGKGAFTGKKRANLIGQSKATSKTAASDVEARAIQEMKAEAKGNIVGCGSLAAPATESDITAINSGKFDTFTKVNNLSTVLNDLTSAQSSSEIWKWFLIGTLLLLCIELLIQKMIK
jgi:hypothetical protein